MTGQRQQFRPWDRLAANGLPRTRDGSDDEGAGLRSRVCPAAHAQISIRLSSAQMILKLPGRAS